MKVSRLFAGAVAQADRSREALAREVGLHPTILSPLLRGRWHVHRHSAHYPALVRLAKRFGLSEQEAFTSD